MSRAYWKTVQLKLSTEISYWSCLPITDRPPPPSALGPQNLLLLIPALFHLFTSLVRSPALSFFRTIHSSTFYGGSPLFPGTSLPVFWSVPSLSCLWLLDWLTFNTSPSLSLFLLNFCSSFAYPSLFINLFSCPCRSSTTSCHLSVIVICHPPVTLSLSLLSFYFPSSPPFAQMHQFCSQLHTLVII